MDLSCVKSLISQCIEPHIKFHVLLLKSSRKTVNHEKVLIANGDRVGGGGGRERLKVLPII